MYVLEKAPYAYVLLVAVAVSQGEEPKTAALKQQNDLQRNLSSDQRFIY